MNTHTHRHLKLNKKFRDAEVWVVPDVPIMPEASKVLQSTNSFTYKFTFGLFFLPFLFIHRLSSTVLLGTITQHQWPQLIELEVAWLINSV